MKENYIKEKLIVELKKLTDKIDGCFSGKCGRKQAQKYIIGLLSQVDRKNAWKLSEARGERTPYAIQQFLYRGNWNADEVRDCLHSYIQENLGSEEAVL